MKSKFTLIFIVVFGSMITLLSFYKKEEQKDQLTPIENPPLENITADQLMTELGCNACHAGLSKEVDISNRAPSLENAGERYNSAFLFDYLKKPYMYDNILGIRECLILNFRKRRVWL